MNLVDELHAIIRCLRQAHIEHAICGGIAVTIHGATRTTKDIDLLVLPDDVPRIIEMVRPLGYIFAALPMTFDAGTPRARRVQRVSKLENGQHMILDLLLADEGLQGFLDGKVEVTLPEGTLAVVSLDALLKMKRLAARTQDLADVEALERNDEV